MKPKVSSVKKKLSEATILKMVYPVNKFKEIKSTEDGGLDFLITRNDNTCFGVQITQLYPSESAARLENINGYKDTLLKTGNHLHKDDVHSLVCDEIDMYSSDGKKIREKAIIVGLPDYQGKIEAIIDKKQKKLLADVDTVLIIYDQQKSIISAKYFCKIFFNQQLAQVAIKSRFREIYFITKIGEKFIFIPLKLAGILREVCLFNHTLEKIEYSIDSVFIEFNIMCEFLRLSGIEAIRYTRQKNVFTLLLGDIDLKIDYSNRSSGIKLEIVGLHCGYSYPVHKNIKKFNAIKTYLLPLLRKINSEHSITRLECPIESNVNVIFKEIYFFANEE